VEGVNGKEKREAECGMCVGTDHMDKAPGPLLFVAADLQDARTIDSFAPVQSHLANRERTKKRRQTETSEKDSTEK
jgi:hypothetical protein